MENVVLAGLEDSQPAGSLSAFDDGFAYARKSPVEMTLLDASLTPLTICAGDRSWTSEPAMSYSGRIAAPGSAGTTMSTPFRWSGSPAETSFTRSSTHHGLQQAAAHRPGVRWVQTINSPVVVIPEERHGWSTGWLGGGEGVLVT